jgi:hypothetical protein
MRLPRVLLLACACALTSCVSTRLAEANLESVTALAHVAVEQNPESMPQADAAVQTASDLVEATGTFAQLTSLGVSSELTDANLEHVRNLVTVVAVDATPEVQTIARRAQGNAAELAGKSRAQQSFVTTAKATPVGDWLTGVLSIIGAAGTAIYGSTRGRKHFARWWHEPPPEPAPPAPPNADGPA